ncbi:DNA repair protein [Vibrio albus]|uniref:DNA repair protein n=1 Tax=Vibrio albus TaxID=2200953 RepID=A0A2U3BEH2_9VIBR|nr:DNA repair protein [Vibrio albus]PWI35186.1 DNA repair protein [Vibrio albus]
MKTIKTVLAASVLLTIVGCQSTPEQPREIAATNQEQKDNAYELYQNSKEQYQSWLSKLKEAENLRLYSVTQYRDLLDSWNEAVDIYEEIAVTPSKTTESYSLFSDGTYSDHFNTRLAVVEKNYNSLLALKETADEVLADAIAQMAYLDKIDASSVYAMDYKQVYRTYQGLFKVVEDNELDTAQTKQVVFLSKAQKLEMKVVIKRYVYPLKKKLKDLRKDEFDEVAAISYAKAKAEIDTTEQTIRSNPRNLEIIESAVKDAEFELTHVRSVALEVKRLANVEDEAFEPVVLEFENKLLAISQALEGADYRDQSLHVQAESILNSISLLNEEQDEENSAHSQKVKNLTQELSRLKLKLELVNTEKEKTEQEKLVLNKQISQLEDQITSQQTLLAAYQEQLAAKANADKAVEPENKAGLAETGVENEEPEAVEAPSASPTESELQTDEAGKADKVTGEDTSA